MIQREIKVVNRDKQVRGYAVTTFLIQPHLSFAIAHMDPVPTNALATVCSNLLQNFFELKVQLIYYKVPRNGVIIATDAPSSSLIT